MSNATNTENVLPIKQGDGLFLRGLIVAVDDRDRTWEGKTWQERRVTIANGVKAFTYVASNKNGETLPEVQAGRRAKVAVDFASTDKGVMLLRGDFSYEN